MGILSAKLDQLESRLQILIEGRLARLLPSSNSREDLIHRLVAAMKDGAEEHSVDFTLAPDVYFLFVHPDDAQRLLTNQPFLSGLANIIQEAGAVAGFRFLQSPVVNISPNSDVPRSEINVLARLSQAPLGETVAMTSATDAEQNNIPTNAFLIVNGVRIFTLEKPVISIGRRSDNDLVIDDPRISRQHVQLRAARGRYIISDLESTGGTFVNGTRVTQCMLNPRDVISLAGIPMVYGQDDYNILSETQKYEPQEPSEEDKPTRDYQI